MKNKIIINDRDHLKTTIEQEVSIHGNNCDLNHLDVSKVKDMTCMFDNSSFNGDISKWNVYKVKNMNGMFFNSQFNKNLDDWKPYKLQAKENMFDNCPALLPYWYIAENTQRAIELYELKEKLDNNLDNKNITKIRIKI